MTQLDLPPISFARYLELLKRRRWQVIPMSLLGLVVGAIIAFFIPRYYVAETMLVYTGAVLDKDSKTESDPLYQMVLGAKLSVVSAIPQAAEDLQWVGTNPDDPMRQAVLDKLRDRTSVESWQVSRERSDYAVKITYRDPDGQRAAEFANRLRETWTSELMQQFNDIALRELQMVTATETQLANSRDNQVREINNFRDEYGIERGMEGLGQPGVESLIRNDLRIEEAELVRLEGELVGVRSTLAFEQQRIEEGVIEPKIQKVTPLSQDPQLAERVATLMQQLAYNQTARDVCVPGTTDYTFYQRRLEAVQRQLRELAPNGVESGGRVQIEDNPLYQEKLREISQLKARLESLQAQLDVHRRAVASLREELDGLPEIWRQYEVKLAEKDSLEERLSAAHARADALREKYQRARTINPFTRVNRAFVPPAPTDPNVTLVALAGSVLGLAVAIGLVLLLDIVRASFKTADDVGYALKLPVLGVMSYLETDEVRTRTVRQRRFVSVIIGAFVTLVLAIVTVYYVAPTRLPTSVLQLLDAVLGSGETAR